MTIIINNITNYRYHLEFFLKTKVVMRTWWTYWRPSRRSMCPSKTTLKFHWVLPKLLQSKHSLGETKWLRNDHETSKRQGLMWFAMKTKLLPWLFACHSWKGARANEKQSSHHWNGWAYLEKVQVEIYQLNGWWKEHMCRWWSSRGSRRGVPIPIFFQIPLPSV